MHLVNTPVGGHELLELFSLNDSVDIDIDIELIAYPDQLLEENELPIERCLNFNSVSGTYEIFQNSPYVEHSSKVVVLNDSTLSCAIFTRLADASEIRVEEYIGRKKKRLFGGICAVHKQHFGRYNHIVYNPHVLASYNK